MTGRQHRVRQGMNTFVVGDIHGSVKALEQACERADVHPDRDRLVALGDVADGWPWTPACVDFLLQFKHLKALLGNHDVWTSEWLNRGLARPGWLSQGGLATVKAYETWTASATPTDRDRHRTFFRTLLPFFIDEKNRLFVHAGADRRFPVRRNPVFDLTWDRTLWDDAEDVHLKNKRIVLLIDPEEGVDGGRLIVSRSAVSPSPNRIHEVFIGHTSVQTRDDPFPIPRHRAGIWNLDTGAGWDGVLTVMNADTGVFHQSDPAHVLYPEEMEKRRTGG